MGQPADIVLEVKQLSKLYSRSPASARRRARATLVRALLGRTLEPPTQLNEGEFWSLRDINFTLRRGEALGVIGLNGAGKTTLLRILAGQLLPDAGEIRISGNPASLIDLTAGFQMNATGRQNIFLRGAMLGRNREEIEQSYDAIIEFAELGDAIDSPVSTYSSGMLMRLAFSIMITTQPDVLFIDEILAVGDFRFQQKCLAYIRELRSRSAFILVSHAMSSIKLFCDRAIVLNKGKLAFIGAPEEAIALYENFQTPNRGREKGESAWMVGQQFHNESAISDVEHFWTDASGKKTNSVLADATLCLHVRFRLHEAHRNLVVGVPMWTDKGEHVTGFSTETSGPTFDLKAGRVVSLTLVVPTVALNPANYVSVLSIADGLEILYRIENPVLTVLPSRIRYWGLVTLPYEWKESSFHSYG